MASPADIKADNVPLPKFIENLSSFGNAE